MNPSRANDFPTRATYGASGVAAQAGGLQQIAAWVTKTFDFNPAKPLLPLGYYANVLQLTPDLGLAISTDGVGTKLLVAQQLGKYDTVGIDCVAMNANDIICVGARPISMVDYVAVERAEPDFLGEIGKGLYEGARRAGITIPGGEIAQVREMIQGVRPGRAFDLVGTCVGIVHPQRLLIGADVQPGDCIVGIASSGIHSNGFTLARRVLFERAKLRVSDQVAELGRSVGEELLEPTAIYVREIVEMLDAGLALKALIHVTGDGFLNLTRVEAEAGLVIEHVPDPPAIFRLLQERGSIDDAEMFRVYNMGIGFCVIVAPADADRVQAIVSAYGKRATVIGYTVRDPQRRVWITPHNLVSEDTQFRPTSESAPPRPAS